MSTTTSTTASTITGATTAAQTANAQGATSTLSNPLGKDVFLKLLTVQLANQNPLDPVDNQSFIAQLAQFSSLEQMQDVSTQLGTLTSAMLSSNQLGTATLVGKKVTYQASGLDLASGSTPGLQVTLPSAARVTAVIADSTGNTVRVLDLGAQNAGTFSASWDGRDQSGNTLPAGHYSVKLSGTAADGSSVSVSAATQGLVTGVSLANGATQLVVGSSLVNLSDVQQITQP